MTFTKQDLYTFILGALGAGAVVVAEAAKNASFETWDDVRTWAIALGGGLLSALLRYIGTRGPELLSKILGR